MYTYSPVLHVTSNVELSHAKRPGSVAEGQRTSSTSDDGLIVRQTPSYSTSNVELSYAKLPDSVPEAQNTCSIGEYEFIVVKRPAIGRQTSSYLMSNI